MTAFGAFRRLDLTVQRRIDSPLSGEHYGLRLGPGSETEELSGGSWTCTSRCLRSSISLPGSSRARSTKRSPASSPGKPTSRSASYS